MPLKVDFDDQGNLIAEHVPTPTPPDPLPVPVWEERYNHLMRSAVHAGEFTWEMSLLPYVLLEHRGDLPDNQHGLYVVYASDGAMLYVGKVGKTGTNFCARWRQHHKLEILREDAAASGRQTRIAWMASEAPDAFLEALEKLWIAVLHPVYNDKDNADGWLLRHWRRELLAKEPLYDEGEGI